MIAKYNRGEIRYIGICVYVVCVRACVRVCVCMCVRACVRAYVYALYVSYLKIHGSIKSRWWPV